MDNWKMPPITDFPAEYDPMRRRFAMVRNFPVQTSVPSSVSVPSGTANQASSGYSRMQEIYKYMYPIDPTNNNSTVIGVYTGGLSRTSKKYFKDVYHYFNIPLVCHSCGKILEPVEETICIGDHQPPTSLKELIDFPEKLAMGIMGDKGRIAINIMSNQMLAVYNFKCRVPITSGDGKGRKATYQNLSLQTNNPQIIPQDAQEKISYIYGRCGAPQYLYPHCEECSNRQGRILQGCW